METQTTDAAPAASAQPEATVANVAAEVSNRRGGVPDDIRNPPSPSAKRRPDDDDDAAEQARAPESEKPLKLREAANNLSEWREQKAQERATFEKAMGLHNDAPTEPVPASQPREEVQRTQITPEQAAQIYAQQSAQQHQAMSRVAALQASQQIVAMEFQRDFPEVKSESDLHALGSIDPDRYARAVAAVNRARSLAVEHDQIGNQLVQHQRAQYAQWANAEDHKFVEMHPEMKDAAVATKVTEAALSEFKKIGFTDQEVNAAWNGEASLHLRDARVQSLLMDAIRFRQAKAASRPAPKPLPPVSRPGVSQHGQRETSRIQKAERNFEQRPDIRNAAKLLSARRAARRK